MHDEAAFYYLRGAEDFRALRAAVLALTDMTGRTIIAELRAGEEGRMTDGTDCLAAVGVLQRIGVATVILSAAEPEQLEDALERIAPYARLSVGVCVPCQWLRDGIRLTSVLQRIGVATVILSAAEPEQLEDALERIAPYARLSVGVCVPCQWLRDGIRLTNVELLLPAAHERAEQVWQALENYQGGRTVSRDHDDVILAPDGRDAHFIDAVTDISENYQGGRTVSRDHDDVILAPDGRDAHFIDAVTDISDEIACDCHLEENLLAIEDEEAAALKLLIHEEDDLYNLETDVYMLSRPVCLCAEDPELLERALRIYHGLAIYDGTWEQDPALVKYFSEKYGMICL